MKFSERQGITKVKDIVQLNSMDDDLRNSLWNIFYKVVLNKIVMDSAQVIRRTNYWSDIQNLWFKFYKEPIDTIPALKDDVIYFIKKEFYNYKWYQVYDFIEYFIKSLLPHSNSVLIWELDQVLKNECSAYRVINNEFVPISDEEQLKTIQEVLDYTSTGKLKGVNIHIKSALTHLSDKTSPDYRNSIKESISAIESLSQIISGKPNATLGNALNSLKSKIKIHPALEKGFSQLYGYTSESDGIRHALLEEHSLDQEDAIYMLISCSSFINYLMVKANKAQIKFA